MHIQECIQNKECSYCMILAEVFIEEDFIYQEYTWHVKLNPIQNEM